MNQFIRNWVSISILGIVACGICAASSAPQVKTRSGMVEGKDDGTVRAFLGIPYAAPPVGELR
jgi:para-nitrobenzyl esterase